MAFPVPSHNRAFLVLVVSALHVLLPWAAAMACLGLALQSAAVPVGAPRDTVVIVVGIACLFLVELPRPLSLKPSWGHLPMATSVIARWLWIVAILAVVRAISPVLAPVPLPTAVVWALATPLAVIAARTALRKLLARLLAYSVTARTAVIAGYGRPSSQLAHRLRNTPDLYLRFTGFFDDRSAARLDLRADEPLLGGLADLCGYVRREGINVIFVALPLRNVKRVTDLMDELHDSTVSIYYVPDIFVFDLIQARATEIDGMPVVAMRETPLQGYNMLVKRAIDVTLSLAMLLVVAPLLLVTALAIKLTSPGPVFFRQRRYGLDGREIVVYKFRTMSAAASSGPVTQATRSDPRFTPVGALLRRTSVDELPQLFNVLAGTMSLVGPRPHAVEHNETYRKLIKGYMTRHKVLPGITGLAQVSGCRGETTRLEDMERRVAFDIDYMRHWSPLLDLRILLQTCVTVWRDKKAY